MTRQDIRPTRLASRSRGAAGDPRPADAIAFPVVDAAPGFLWSLPNSAIGLVFGALSFRRPRLLDVSPHEARRVLVFDGPARGYARLIPLFGYSAQTFGHVLIGTVRIEGELLAHELEHVRQYRRWGPLFLPVCGAMFLRYGYRRHPFELAAARAAQGAETLAAQEVRAS